MSFYGFNALGGLPEAHFHHHHPGEEVRSVYAAW